MRTILVPTDFSECSATAIKYAIHFAEKTERKLLFFHSTFLLIPTRSSDVAYFNAVQAEKELKLNALIEFTDKIYQSLNVKREEFNTKFLIKFGTSVMENIIEVTNEQFIDLIIIGTHGASGFRKIFVGSNTASAIEESYCPILAIPNTYKFEGVNTIAYACSDLNNLRKELKPIVRIAQKLEASLMIFYIATGDESMEKYDKFLSEKFIRALSNHFKFDNMSLFVRAIEENNLLEAIGRFVKLKKPDMVAMLTHKKSFFETIFDPSQTKEISYQLKVPLLAVK